MHLGCQDTPARLVLRDDYPVSAFWKADRRHPLPATRRSGHPSGQARQAPLPGRLSGPGTHLVRFPPALPAPHGLADVALGECHGELSELSDGTLVATHDRRYPRDRAQLLARISRDQGQTWSPEVYGLTLPGGTATGSSRRGHSTGYASFIVLEDDTIVTMTGAGTCVRWRIA